MRLDKYTYSIIVGVALTLFLTSCNLSTQSSPTPDTAAVYTMAAQTVEAELTGSAPSATPIQVTSTQAAQATTPASPTLPTLTLTPTLTPTPSQTPSPAEAPPPLPGFRTLLQDDFANEGGWYTATNEDFGFEYTESGYRIYVNILNAAVWSVRELDISDSRLTLQARGSEGPADGYYGVTCRHQDEDNYYGLVISNNGSYGIIRMAEGELSFIQEGIDNQGIINPSGVNQITADCIGSMLTLYANERKLIEVQDDLFSSGSVGMLVGTRRAEGFSVIFDEITILGP